MKSIRFLLILIIVVAGLGISQHPARAGAFTYTSSINVQNLENLTASITIHFYNQDGTENITPVLDTIGALGSKVYFPIPANTGFNGSVVIESTAQIASVSNIHGNNFAANASYVSTSTGSTTVLVPLLMKGNSGYNTWFNVQNTSSTTDANVLVTYSDGTSASGTIKPGAAKTFDQATETHTPKVFSAIVQSTNSQPLAATVIEESTKIMFAYNGFGTTANNPVMPLINANNSGYATGVQIQNSGGSSTDVIVSYTPSLFGTACTETQTIPAGQSKTFALYSFAGVPLAGMTTTCAGGVRFVGSAKVTTNSASQPLVAEVNQFKGTLNGGAYDGFDATTATGNVVLPLIMNANSGYWTSINLMNVGASSGTATCTFTPYGAVPLPTLTKTLAPGEGISWLQAAGDEFGSTKYIGSATCSAPGTQIVAIVNELGASSSADQLLVYEGINMP
ncbi:MAG: hypothetical protein WAM09_00555 [Anaerolineales bacterium]